MASYRDLVLAHGAVAYWRLGETSGTSAFSEVGGYTGTISGGVTLNQPGALADGNAAMAFNGTTGKIAGGALSVAATVTIEAWINTATFQDRSVFSNRNQLPTGLYFGVSGTGSAFFFNNTVVQGVTVVTDGRWHHIALTHDGTTARLYVDGGLDVSVTSANPATSTPWNLGFDVDNNGYFVGMVDDVAIYHTALTPAQIADHYAARLLLGPGTAALDAPVVLPPAGRPSTQWVPLTPSDVTDTPFSTLWVGGAGTVAAVGTDGREVLFTGVTAGTRLRIAGRRVNNTNTTATDILALQR